MAPKQEEYDASKDPFNTRRIYTAIEEVERIKQELEVKLAALKKAAYEGARALDEERAKSQQLQDKLDVKG